MILRRVEITLTSPDLWTEEFTAGGLAAEERKVLFFFRDVLNTAVREIQRELPEGFEIEVAGDR